MFLVKNGSLLVLAITLFFMMCSSEIEGREQRTGVTFTNLKGNKVAKINRDSVNKSSKKSAKESIITSVPTLESSTILETSMPTPSPSKRLSTPSPSKHLTTFLPIQESSDDVSRTSIPIAPSEKKNLNILNETDSMFNSSNILFNTFSPTVNPTTSILSPTLNPMISTLNPTLGPTLSPTDLTLKPTMKQSFDPTRKPTLSPTMSPTIITLNPTKISTSTGSSTNMASKNQINTTLLSSEICVTGSDLSESFGNCLTARDTNGCDSKKCEEIICSDLNDSFCCDTIWDSVCASEAEIYCVLDELPKSNCYSYSATGGCDNELCSNKVCLLDDHCCADNWDFDCIIHSVQFCCTSYFY